MIKTEYRCSDGTVFESLSQAEAHESQTHNRIMNNERKRRYEEEEVRRRLESGIDGHNVDISKPCVDGDYYWNNDSQAYCWKGHAGLRKETRGISWQVVD